jgi:hypothetical protein
MMVPFYTDVEKCQLFLDLVTTSATNSIKTGIPMSKSLPPDGVLRHEVPVLLVPERHDLDL